MLNSKIVIHKYLLLDLIIFFAICTGVTAQYVPGNTYFDTNQWVEYQAGNLPIILVSSHGGYLEPSSLPDRDCQGCSYLRDSYTQEITRNTAAEIQRITGCYPHVIYNLLHRIKLDANREIIEATDSTLIAGPAWYAFHEYIDIASAIIERDWAQGLLIDIHGHAHDLQRLELGTLLSDVDLMLPNDSMNKPKWIEKSSYRYLIGNNISGANHSELLRGRTALGTLLDSCNWPSIPSYNIPFLNPGDPHFNGGYITARHGSRDSGTVDAIQIEGNNELRFSETQRNNFADTLAKKLLTYIDMHYNQNFNNGYCGIQADNTHTLLLGEDCIEVLPEPLNKWYVIEGILEDYLIKTLDIDGNLIAEYSNIGSKLAIDISKLPADTYFINVEHRDNSILCLQKIIKR